MPLTYREDANTKCFEITASGHLNREDYDSVIDQLQSFIDTHGTVRMIEIIESFEGFDPSVIWSGLKFDIRNIRHVSHVAVVSDIGWISPMSKAAGAVLTTKLRTFGMDEIEDARAWILDPDSAPDS